MVAVAAWPQRITHIAILADGGLDTLHSAMVCTSSQAPHQAGPQVVSIVEVGESLAGRVLVAVLGQLLQSGRGRAPEAWPTETGQAQLLFVCSYCSHSAAVNEFASLALSLPYLHSALKDAYASCEGVGAGDAGCIAPQRRQGEVARQ